MTDKINFKIFKPFGSTLAKATLPLELIKDFKEDLKKIRQDKTILALLGIIYPSDNVNKTRKKILALLVHSGT